MSFFLAWTGMDPVLKLFKSPVSWGTHCDGRQDGQTERARILAATRSFWARPDNHAPLSLLIYIVRNRSLCIFLYIIYYIINSIHEQAQVGLYLWVCKTEFVLVSLFVNYCIYLYYNYKSTLTNPVLDNIIILYYIIYINIIYLYHIKYNIF